MRKLLFTLALFTASHFAHAECTVAATASQSALTSALSSAGSASCGTSGAGARAVHITGTGTITISGTITLPCSGSSTSPVILYGDVDNNPTPPNKVFPTATIGASAIGLNGDAFQTGGGCTGLTIHGIAINGAGGFQINGNDNGFISFVHNYVSGIPDATDNGGDGGSTICCDGPHGVDFSGSLANNTSTANGQTVLESYVHDIHIDWNTFGDTTSCPNAATGNWEYINDGCGGIWTYEGEIQNTTFSNNYVFHVNEGIHTNQIRTNFDGTSSNSVADGLLIDNNYFQTIYRNSAELQTSTVNNANHFDHNSFTTENQHFNGVQIGFTIPCCKTGFFESANSPVNPSMVENDNVQTADTANGRQNYGFEYWGNGTLNEYNWVGGYEPNNITWGYFGAAGVIQYVYLCWAPGFTGSGFITNEESQSNPPSQTGVVTSTSCAAATSVAPTVSPSSGSQTFPLTVTMAIPLNMSNFNSGQNTSIYYTTDGTAPVPGSGTTQLYSAPITLTSAKTVKAVGMWGSGPQPLSYPTNYGYVPSGATTAAYTGTTGPTLTSCSQSNSGSTHSLVVGGSTVQQIGSCTYASTSTTTTCSPGADVNGNTITSWGTSNSGILTVSSSGVVTAVAPGTANSTATATGSLACSPYSFTVTNPTVTNVVAALQGGVSTIEVTQQIQACAVISYSAGANQTVCGTGADTYGNHPSGYTSSASGVATMSSSGLLTGVAIGSTNIDVTVGTFTASPKAITVTPIAPNVIMGAL